MKNIKVLVAYDGSDCSNQSLINLRKAGLPDNVEAVVFVVADTWVDESGMAFDPKLNPQWAILMKDHVKTAKALLSEAKEMAKKAAAKLSFYFSDWKVRTEVVAGLPGPSVMRKIDHWKPDLVAMGSHGRSAVGRLIFGSVSHNVLAHAHCNLRISRCVEKKISRVGPLRILVAYDGSEEAETAFQSVLSRRWPKGTHIRLVTVIDPKVSIAFARPTGAIRSWVKNADTNPTAWIERMFSDQWERIQMKGFIGDTEALTGDPKQVLLKEAEKWGADCIFVGSRGLSGKERIMTGSVSMALAMHAPCAVEVIHTGPMWRRHENKEDGNVRKIIGQL